MSDGRLRVVLDTNVVFEGLTSQGSAGGLIVDAFFAELFTLCVSGALAYEYLDVLSRQLSAGRWTIVRPHVAVLLERAEFVRIYYRWRPASPDAGDDMIIDLVMNANAILVTYNIKDFLEASSDLGFYVQTPLQFLELMAR